MHKKQIQKNITDLQDRIVELRLLPQTRQVINLLKVKQQILRRYELKLTNKLKQLTKQLNANRY